MGTIIGEGITFDDVLLVPGYSEVIFRGDSKPSRFINEFNKNDPFEHSDDECGNGYGNRTPYGDCNGAPGGHWYYP